MPRCTLYCVLLVKVFTHTASLSGTANPLMPIKNFSISSLVRDDSLGTAACRDDRMFSLSRQQVAVEMAAMAVSPDWLMISPNTPFSMLMTRGVYASVSRLGASCRLPMGAYRMMRRKKVSVAPPETPSRSNWIG